MVISADDEHDPDVLSITGASAALYLSDIPFHTPIAGVRVGLVEGKYLVNPTYEQLRNSELSLTVAGSEEGICMVEAGAKEVSEQVMIEALMFATARCASSALCNAPWARRSASRSASLRPRPSTKTCSRRSKRSSAPICARRSTPRTRRRSRVTRRLTSFKTRIVESYPEEDAAKRKEAGSLFDVLTERIFRDDILNNRRPPRWSALLRDSPDCD